MVVPFKSTSTCSMICVLSSTQSWWFLACFKKTARDGEQAGGGTEDGGISSIGIPSLVAKVCWRDVGGTMLGRSGGRPSSSRARSPWVARRRHPCWCGHGQRGREDHAGDIRGEEDDRAVRRAAWPGGGAHHSVVVMQGRRQEGGETMERRAAVGHESPVRHTAGRLGCGRRWGTAGW